MTKQTKPKPYSWRPKSQEVKDLFLRKGGATWLNQFLVWELEYKAAKRKAEAKNETKA